MTLGKYGKEQLVKMSMMEVAQIVLTEQKIELNFIDLFNKVADAKDFTSAQKDDLLSRFYTDLNVDGRFSTIGSNKWGLRRWYPADQTNEKALAKSRKLDADELEEEAEAYYEEDETLQDGLDKLIEEDEGETEEAEVI